MTIRLTMAAAVAAMAAACGAAELDVGADKPLKRIEDALARAGAGDVIRVHPGPGNGTYEKVALYVDRPRLTIRAVGAQRIKLCGQGFDYSGRGRTPRAIVQFNPGADGCVLEGFELYGARNGSFNGAGVRINQANDVTVRNCDIHDNDMGIMSNGNGTQAAGRNQLIESCLIRSNGTTRHPGYNHNLYLGGTSVTLRGCEIHSSVTGHNIKSRAHLTRVLGCYVHDSSNREMDLVDGQGDTSAPGSDAVVAGCVIVKARACKGNRAVIHFGQDGGKGHDGTLYLVHNTIVTPYIGAVADLSAPRARARIVNNIVWNGGQRQNGQKLLQPSKGAQPRDAARGKTNYLSAGFAGDGIAFLTGTILAPPDHQPPFVAPDKGDYRLRAADPAVTAAGSPADDELRKALDGPLLEYVHPLQTRERKLAGKGDLGAYSR
ncbi:MAG: hypothetical protein BWX88_00449 [Planctomycetes bacterium ADurb.Bin126]|nr:MAG: hypothetical protein BWX88_00449 [Planctomycetes bacterium ADurb.Bin126]HOD80197.1 right-handed parallel beta-helix repeat-containing protein [Phycisphaerae bacterium]HQL71669.1 right-handed parallel beta-helix repeat-containing protein [Phycisphaerae bacterium]